MRNKIIGPLFFTILLTSCVRKECKDCTKLFDSEFSTFELDSIVQELIYYSDLDSINYKNWNEFTVVNFPELNTKEEVCSKYGGMVSVDPLGDTQDFREVWYSNGSADLLLLQNGFFELGYIYYDCE